jgi:hypothetical protein
MVGDPSKRSDEMSVIVYLALWLMLGVSVGQSCDCLPQDIKPNDVVSVRVGKPGSGGPATAEKLTVAMKLKELNASCKDAKLVDGAGKEIYFYRLQGCWGNPPEDYQEILRKQGEELSRLRKTYQVVEMTCNPEGAQIH